MGLWTTKAVDIQQLLAAVHKSGYPDEKRLEKARVMLEELHECDTQLLHELDSIEALVVSLKHVIEQAIFPRFARVKMSGEPSDAAALEPLLQSCIRGEGSRFSNSHLKTAMALLHASISNGGALDRKRLQEAEREMRNYVEEVEDIHSHVKKMHASVISHATEIAASRQLVNRTMSESNLDLLKEALDVLLAARRSMTAEANAGVSVLHQSVKGSKVAKLYKQIL